MTTTFTVDDIALDYSEKDYEPQRPEPKADTYFEFEVKSARVKQHKDGYLTASLTVNALSDTGSTMFTKFINLAVPVAIRGISAPDWAKNIFLNTLRPLFPELAPYDMVEQDPVTGKNIYLKDGAPLKGKAYDEAQKASNKLIGAMAVDFAKAFITSGEDEASLEVLKSRRFFGQVKKSGDFTNVVKMRSSAPTEGACYDRKQAFGGK